MSAAPVVLTFVVPMPPTLTNSGKGRSRHWRVLERERKDYWNHLDIVKVVSAHGDRTTRGRLFTAPPPPPSPLSRAEIASSMVLGGAMDDDNAMARHKWLIDWLVANGYLASDRRTCVRWAGLPEQRVSKKEPARITLTLTAA